MSLFVRGRICRPYDWEQDGAPDRWRIYRTIQLSSGEEGLVTTWRYGTHQCQSCGEPITFMDQGSMCPDCFYAKAKYDGRDGQGRGPSPAWRRHFDWWTTSQYNPANRDNHAKVGGCPNGVRLPNCREERENVPDQRLPVGFPNPGHKPPTTHKQVLVTK